jgi:hypothetical protein
MVHFTRCYNLCRVHTSLPSLTPLEVAAGGDDRVNANYLTTTLYKVARSWLVNLPERTI